MDIDCERFPDSVWNNVVYDVNPLGSNSSLIPPLGGKKKSLKDIFIMTYIQYYAGSCLEAGYTECCSDFICLGSPTLDCFCDPSCHSFGDCCYDIDQSCPSGSGPQPSRKFKREAY